MVFGSTRGNTRVIKARDLNADGIVDSAVGNTFQTQSRLYLGAEGGAPTTCRRGRERTAARSGEVAVPLRA